MPDAVGVNVTEIVQTAFAAKLRSAGVGLRIILPEAAMPLRTAPLCPVLLSVTVCAALVVPTVWLAKVSCQETN